jgi:hypothetical protein
MSSFRLAPTSTTCDRTGSIGEDVVNALAQEGHPSDDDYGNQGHQQTVLNGGGAGLILKKISDLFHFISLQVFLVPSFLVPSFQLRVFGFWFLVFPFG